MRIPQFLLAVAAISSSVTTVAAHGPFLLWSNKFSKTAMEDWISTIRSDKSLAQDYKTVTQSRENSRCLALDDRKGLKYKSHRYQPCVCIWLLGRALGRSWFLVMAGTSFYTSMRKPNDTKFIYNINGGACGHILVTTSKQIGFTYLEYKWSTPEYHPPHTYNYDNIDLKSIKVDASGALRKAERKHENVKEGVSYVTLRQHRSTESPRYFFAELKGAPWDVYVDASSGAVTP